MPTPILLAHVAEIFTPGDVELLFEDRHAVRRVLEPLRGKPVEVVIRRRRSKRSLRQNAWLWGLAIPLIAEGLGYDRHEHEAVHYALVAHCFGTTRDPRLRADVPKVRSSKLTTKEFSDYMEWLVRFAATDLGVVVPLPDDVDLTAYEAAS